MKQTTFYEQSQSKYNWEMKLQYLNFFSHNQYNCVDQ